MVLRPLVKTRDQVTQVPTKIRLTVATRGINEGIKYVPYQMRSTQ